MKVKRVIELLNDIYNLDDELMIDWVDKEQMDGDGEMNDEIWELSVARIENASEGMIDLYYVQDTVNEAQRHLKRRKYE